MAATLQIKRRIRTAQNIAKTTRALNMIATSKLKRAQETTVSSRPYADTLIDVMRSIVANIEPGEKISYLKENTSQKDLYVVIAPDKGLCGSMIPNLVREYHKETKNADCSVITIGKKIEPYVARSQKDLLASFPFGNTIPHFSAVYPIVAIIDEHFLKENVKNVYIITTQFKSVFAQVPAKTQLLPINVPTEDVVQVKSKAIVSFEPSAEAILPALLHRYIEMTIYHAMLESYASFQAAQMTAMKNATDNANDITSELKLLYNKMRQERITSELLDIAGSAFAN
jgi:F-type H+-transporting ATPase subunit gamma